MSNGPGNLDNALPPTLDTLLARSPLLAGNFRRLAELFDFGSRKSLGDFGGSSGVLCCCVCQRHPHMTAVTYDLPPVHSVAVAHVRSQGLEERVQVCAAARSPLERRVRPCSIPCQLALRHPWI